MAFSLPIEAIHQLRQQVAGQVLLPDDPAYEQMRRGWNRAIDQYPALILLAARTQDIIAGVRFARVNGLGVGVQSTGHGVQYPADEGLLIVTSGLTSVQIDVQRCVARVEAGAVWQRVLDEAAPHGLAPLMGTAPHLGVVGYTLGGGLGWLGRRYGFAGDSVNWLEVVTADGTLQRVSSREQSDLFWGLRGGGGSLGIVTALEFNLYPVATVYGGCLVYPGQMAGEVLRFFRAWVQMLPDEMTSSLMIAKYPLLPQVPEALRGQVSVTVRVAYAGEEASGAALMQPWLAWHAPLSQTLRTLPFAEIGTIQNDPVDPAPAYGTSEIFNTLSDDALTVLTRHATDVSSPLIFSELRHAGGALARSQASAIGNRQASFYLQIGGRAFSPAGLAALEEAMQRYKNDLRPYLSGGGYLNFMGGPEASRRLGDAYQAQDYQRLLALKATYDPENLFRYSYQLTASRPAHVE